MAIEPTTYARYLGLAASEPPHLLLPLASSRASAGYPSPAEDFLDGGIDLNDVMTQRFLHRSGC